MLNYSHLPLHKPKGTEKSPTWCKATWGFIKTASIELLDCGWKLLLIPSHQTQRAAGVDQKCDDHPEKKSMLIFKMSHLGGIAWAISCHT